MLLQAALGAHGKLPWTFHQPYLGVDLMLAREAVCARLPEDRMRTMGATPAARALAQAAIDRAEANSAASAEDVVSLLQDAQRLLAELADRPEATDVLDQIERALGDATWLVENQSIWMQRDSK